MQPILMNLYDKFSICMILTIYFFISHNLSYSQEILMREFQNTSEFLRSPEQSDMDKQNNLEEKYFDGYGETQDLGSFSLLKESAEQGHVKAQYKLSTMYYNAEGVGQNYQEPLYWLDKYSKPRKLETK